MWLEMLLMLTKTLHFLWKTLRLHDVFAIVLPTAGPAVGDTEGIDLLY